MSEANACSATQITVETSDLFAHAAVLGAANETLSGWRERSKELRVHFAGAYLPIASGGSPETALAEVEQRILAMQTSIVGVRGALMAAAFTYGETEADIEAVWRAGERVGAWLIGASAPLWAPSAIFSAVVIGVAVSVAKFVSPEQAGEAIDEVARTLLADPEFVKLVGTSINDSDEFVSGMFGFAPSLTNGDGVNGPENAGFVLLAVAGLRVLGFTGDLLAERDVTVTRVATPGTRSSGAPLGHPAAGIVAREASVVQRAPEGFADLTERIPDDGESQIRIEQYGGEPGSGERPRFIVYVSGTLSGSLISGEQPWDMTSNLAQVAQAGVLAEFLPTSAGERAVRQAMAEAGIEPGDEVLAIGHSAGGMISAHLASDGTVSTAVNVGGPAVANQPDDGSQVVQFTHTDDVVPVTGGHADEHERVFVYQREAFEGEVPGDADLPAHALTEYQRTAARFDAEAPADGARYHEALARITRGESPTRTDWIAKRVEDD